MAKPRASAIVCLVVLGGFVLHDAEADAIKAVAHGAAISAADVGPATAGYRDLKSFAGSEIKDGIAYPFARSIDGSAKYDGFEVDGPHLLIEGVAFSSNLDIYTSKPVVLRGVSVHSSSERGIALLTRPNAGPIYVLWSDIDSNGDAAIALRASHAMVYRSHAFGAADGIDISGSQVRIEESLIEVRGAREGDHNDAIQLLGSPRDIDISRNRIANRNPQTSAVYLLGTHIDVRDNYIAGGGWSVYGGRQNNGHGGGHSSAVTVSGNAFGKDYWPKSGHFGPVTYWHTSNTWLNNRYTDGRVIAP